MPPAGTVFWVQPVWTPLVADRVAAADLDRARRIRGEVAVEVVDREELDLLVLRVRDLPWAWAPGAAMASAVSASPRMRAPLRACEICIEL